MPIAASVASHQRPGWRSPFAAKAMMRFTMVSLMISGCRPSWRAAIVLPKAAPQHRNRFGVKIGVGRNESKNLTDDAGDASPALAAVPGTVNQHG
jgi:hypothetical protein